MLKLDQCRNVSLQFLIYFYVNIILPSYYVYYSALNLYIYHF